MDSNLEKEMQERANELVKSSISNPDSNPEKQQISKVEQFNNNINQLPQYQYNDNKTLDENAAELSELVASKEALKDETFVKEVAETKKEQIKESAKVNSEIHIAKKEAEKLAAINEADKQYFEQWKMILNWGGVKAPCKRHLERFLVALILPFFTIKTLFVEIPIAIISSILNCINQLLEQISNFGKWARRIAISLLILGSIALIVYIILLYLNKYNVIDIF